MGKGKARPPPPNQSHPWKGWRRSFPIQFLAAAWPGPQAGMDPWQRGRLIHFEGVMGGPSVQPCSFGNHHAY